VPPSQWLPFIFNEKDPGYASLAEAEDVLKALMALYNDINEGVQQGKVKLPPRIELRRPALANLGGDAPLSGWARGFVIGHDYLSSLWDDYIPEALSGELDSSMLILSFFGGRRLAEILHNKIAGNTRTLEEMAEDIARLFPGAMKSYAHLGWSIQAVLNDRDRPQPLRTEKIGRNDPCPCGSGKKYKKCCG
jgi:uncharacterized protein YecA (UPF0149 family)